jgi:hypothetical protein
MYKKIIILLLVTISSKLISAQKLTAKDITGQWLVSSMVADGLVIPLDSEEALRNFMYSQTRKQKGDTTDAAPTADDSAGVEMAVQVLGMFRESELNFLANKTFKFSLSIGGTKSDKTGTWAFNEAAQTMRFSEIKKGKPVKSDIVKIIVRGNQLLLQMEKDKEEGLLLTKKK